MAGEERGETRGRRHCILNLGATRLAGQGQKNWEVPKNTTVPCSGATTEG